MKLSYPVKLSAIKHEYDPKVEAVMTTLHLELPSGVDLKTLKLIHRRSRKPMNGESGEYHLIVREKDGGAPRKYRVESKGTKTKDYALFAVVQKFFSEFDGLEKYLDQGTYTWDDDQLPQVIFEPELLRPEDLVTQAVRQFDQDMKDQGMTVTLSAGGTSATLGVRDGDPKPN